MLRDLIWLRLTAWRGAPEPHSQPETPK